MQSKSRERIEMHDCGMFAVTLEIQDGTVVAKLTGDHFKAEEEDVSRAICGSCAMDLMSRQESPIYLVRDSVVGLAMCAMRRMPYSQVESFTRSILGALELPDGSLSERLSRSVGSIVGISWADAPWDGAMSDEEVEKVFEETKALGLCPEKGSEQ